jgi:hypothetical protein
VSPRECGEHAFHEFVEPKGIMFPADAIIAETQF